MIKFTGVGHSFGWNEFGYCIWVSWYGQERHDWKGPVMVYDDDNVSNFFCVSNWEAA